MEGTAVDAGGRKEGFRPTLSLLLRAVSTKLERFQNKARADSGAWLPAQNRPVQFLLPQPELLGELHDTAGKNMALIQR